MKARLLDIDERLLEDGMQVRLGPFSDPLTPTEVEKLNLMLELASERRIVLGVRTLQAWHATDAEVDAFVAGRREAFRARRQSELLLVIDFVNRGWTVLAPSSATVQ